MRSGLSPGAAARVDAVVTPDMTATLGGRPVHPVLATARMIEWMEWAGRRLILPYLAHGEDAVGYQVEVVHLRPTPVGDRFWAVARFQFQEKNRIWTEVSAHNDRGVIGRGRFIQVVVDQAALIQRFGSEGTP
jgi:predicted thioesterase